METKSTKQRLDELYDLLKSEYITENEFRAARSNILRESGFDLSPRPRRGDSEVTHEERRALQQPERKGSGCGCFLFTLFLIAAIALGAMFAVPEWPDKFGGPYVRMAKERITELWTSFFPSDKPGPVPDPVKPESTPPRAVAPASPTAPAASTGENAAVTTPSQTAGASVPAEEPSKPSEPSPASPDVTPPVSTKPVEPQPVTQTPPQQGTPASIPVPDHAGLPSPDIGLPALPDTALSESLPTAEERDVTTVVIPPSEPASASIPEAPVVVQVGGRANVVRGYITANSARIRSTPDASIRTNVTGWGRSGDRFTVLEEGSDKDGAKWYRVRYEEGNKEGWISASLVKLEK